MAGPIVRRNAYFNIVKLGARPQEYLVDFYGDMGDSVNVGQGSDRLLPGGGTVIVALLGLIAGAERVVLDEPCGLVVEPLHPFLDLGPFDAPLAPAADLDRLEVAVANPGSSEEPLESRSLEPPGTPPATSTRRLT